MWEANGRQGFVDGILRAHLNQHILGVHEQLARDAMLENVNIKNYVGGATNFAGLAASSDFAFPLQALRDVKLRLSIRSRWSLQNFGTYARPVPGYDDFLVITTPGVVYDMRNDMDREYMQTLRDLQDERIINGGVVRYDGFTFVETWDALLWNAGPISKQVGITEKVTAGDGAPNPSTTKLDGIWEVGQVGVKHYVQCSDFGDGDFAEGDFVSVHTNRTAAWGVTNGCDFTHGKTQVMEVADVDHANNRLVFRLPMMDDYGEQFIDATFGSIFGYVTKAQHVHPTYIIAARGGSVFAIRRPIKMHVPPANDDFESVVRVSWDEYGEMNKWNPDLWEIYFGAGSFANRGAVGK